MREASVTLVGVVLAVTLRSTGYLVVAVAVVFCGFSVWRSGRAERKADEALTLARKTHKRVKDTLGVADEEGDSPTGDG